jgi:DNA-binding NtrC family response regulator
VLTRIYKVDVRVVAATNKIENQNTEGRSVSLYHRLAVILIKYLQLNADDIPMLIAHFADKIASEQGNT